jgi:archaellum biogenesis ATPase FlaH
MASETTDEKVYQRAGVRTPAQNAQRDFLGTAWLQLLATEFKKCVWIQTTDTIPIEPDNNVTLLNAASNPFGWDEEEDETFMTLEDLQGLSNAIQNEMDKEKRPIVVESLTPIIMRHGVSQTLAWLRLLVKCKTTVIVPILLESLSSTQHVALEDMAQAVLYLHGGDMTMIRQGVRERGNVLRETVLFQVHTNKANGAVSIQVVNQDDTKEQLATPLLTTAQNTPKLNEGTTASTSTSRPEKVKLQLEDDDTPPSTKEEASRPHIYVQDNDPEFDDMDEEDPDDDLDL